jgi:glycosyltransferase involved in cell wall biosynthesis
MVGLLYVQSISNLVDIVVIRSNSIIYSPRVRKIASSLGKRYNVLVLGWNREEASKEMINNYIAKLKLFNLRAPLGKSCLLLYIPLFWIWTLINLALHKPKVVHACDLDTVLPCYIYKIVFRKRLVFDVCDRYAMAHISPKLRIIYHMANMCEQLIAKHSDVLITVAEKLLRTFKNPPKITTLIMNCAYDDNYIIENQNTQSPNKKYKIKEEKDDNIFSLLYTGNIVRNRGLEIITCAIKDLKYIKLVIAGKPVDKTFLQELVHAPNVDYKGLMSYQDALALNHQSDAVVILYDLSIPNNKFAMPNKLFEAMMCQLPVITNVAPEVVRDEVGCGIIVDYNNMHQIKDAIVTLRDNPGLRMKLGKNGREAFLRKYNWASMEKELLGVYKNLL